MRMEDFDPNSEGYNLTAYRGVVGLNQTLIIGVVAELSDHVAIGR